MHAEPKIIILRGNSGSGKTTIAKALQRYFGKGTFLVSQDMVRREMLYVNDGIDSPAIDLMIDMVKYGKEKCEIVILEGIFYSDWHQKLFETVKNEFGNEIYAYYFDISFEEPLIRHKTRPKASDFGESEMRKWWRDKDYLKIIPESIVDKDMNEETIVSKIKNHMLEKGY